ncbi:DUF58 domain-containing protein [Paraliobacillus quinghaiensis]|uniref:DUF58 domain-containing protein n=1 Tax=Paraliobacillus quinghaiensis TaxID=470815 RepID=UPI0013C34442|nr:DUF58 domain-containing protein [Paraliobacillus quinghaiensis]
MKLVQLILLFSLLFSYAMFQGGFVSWFLLYAFIPILIYLLTVMLYPLRTWNVSRNLSKDITRAGKDIEVTIILERKLWIPLPYLIIEDCYNASLQETYQSKHNLARLTESKELNKNRQFKRVVFPMFKRKLHFTYKLTDLPRGEHQFQAVRIKTGDFFGFVTKSYIFECVNRIVVYPQEKGISMKKEQNSFEEGVAPVYSLRSKNEHVVTGVREYMSGDRFSWIDWKSSARKQMIMTKQFEQEKTTDVFFILDACDKKELNQAAFETNVELVNSFVTLFENKVSNIGLLGLGLKNVYFSPQQVGAEKRLLHHYLATVQPDGDKAFADQLVEQIKRMPINLVVILFLTDLNQGIITALKQVQQRNKHVTLFLTKSSKDLSEEDQRMIQQLRVIGMMVNVCTEEVMKQDQIEVSM